MYKCTECGAQFAKIRDLYSHVDGEHQGVGGRKPRQGIIRPFHCNVCPSSFQVMRKLKKHKQLHANFYQNQNRRRYKITDQARDIWNRLPRGTRVLGKYLRVFDPFMGELLKCPEPGCGFGAVNEASYQLHMKRMHPPAAPAAAAGRHNCSFCSFKFLEPGRLQRHIQAVHRRESRHESRYCARTFVYKNSRRIHERLHEQRGICLPRKPDAYILRGEEASRRRECQSCGQECQNAFQFVQHWLERHGRDCEVKVEQLVIKPISELQLEEPPTYSAATTLCTSCGFRFRSSEYKIHVALTSCGALETLDFAMKEEIEIKIEFPSDFDRDFAIPSPAEAEEPMEPPRRARRLQKHLNFEKDEEIPKVKVKLQPPADLVCEYCGIQLKSRRTWVGHTRLHTGEKPFTCDQCPERFVSNAHRYQHRLLKHSRGSEENERMCEICGQMCKNVYTRTQHMISHHQRPKEAAVGPPIIFSCAICGNGYRHKRTLKKHEILRHAAEGAPPPKFFECKLCDEGFLDVRMMRKHLRKEHADQLQPAGLLQENTIVTAEGIKHSLETYFVRNKLSKYGREENS